MRLFINRISADKLRIINKTLFVFIFAFNIIFAFEEFLIQTSIKNLKAVKESPIVPVAIFSNTIIGRIQEEEIVPLDFDFRIIDTITEIQNSNYFILYHSPYFNSYEIETIINKYSVLIAKNGDAFFTRIQKEENVFRLVSLGFEIKYVTLLPIILAEDVQIERQDEPNFFLQENPVIRAIIDQITSTEVAQFIRELTGEVPVIIRGHLDTIRTRDVRTEKNSAALWYIYEKYQTFAIDSVNFHAFSWFSYTDSNVIATKNGRLYPTQCWIIGGHIDCISDSSLIYAPGADDNATGTVAAIIAAKYMSQYPFKFTVKFIGWNVEERGLIGSAYHAWLARTRGDSILGVLNGDMIATEFTGNDSIRIYTSSRPGSIAIGNTFFTNNQIYDIGLNLRRDTTSIPSSDHYSYWENDYEAIYVHEDDFSPHYHRTTDRILAPEFDTIFLTNVIKAMVATIATLAQPDTQINFISDIPITKFEYIIKAAPNPFQKNTTIYYNTEKGIDVIISIFSSDGKLINRFYRISQFTGLNSFAWDGRDIYGNKKHGIYFLNLKVGNRTFYYKLTHIK